ncbi:NAD-dependent epimerase/dehydratase family protein [Hymenobacter radiodurans]|uniref:NAD-dependent epimerase/dehydratase family protein n=1 Tax=Hymenobacter radiodurans TaxID=2496028 RepID=UPI00196ADE65|nr:NAD-dependent epimerase/dehydratase family protein [Hymenobacter radiodurans]
MGLITCIIGGAGFIGKAVVEELLLRNDRQVIVVGRAPAASHLPATVRYVQNPTGATDELLEGLLAGVDEVIDLAYATVPQTSFHNPVNDILVNLPEAVRLFEHASRWSLRKFVWVSSGGTVYGHAHNVPLTEEHTTNPVSPYGITKLAIEKYAHLYHHTAQLPIVCVRPSNAYGEGQRVYAGQGFVATAIASLLDRRTLSLFGEEGTIRDYLHVRDVARGIVAALVDGQAGQVYNIGSGVGHSNRQVLDILAPLAVARDLPLNIQILPERAFDVKVNVLDSSKLHAHTGWTPTVRFEEGLQQTWEWYVKNHKS